MSIWCFSFLRHLSIDFDKQVQSCLSALHVVGQIFRQVQVSVGDTIVGIARIYIYIRTPISVINGLNKYLIFQFLLCIKIEILLFRYGLLYSYFSIHRKMTYTKVPTDLPDNIKDTRLQVKKYDIHVGDRIIQFLFGRFLDDKLKHFIEFSTNNSMKGLLFEYIKDDINMKDNNGCPALILAIKYRNSELANQLILRGADINMKDKARYTPLMRAINYNEYDLAKTLIDAGADLNIRTVLYSVSKSALSMAIAKKNIDIVKSIINKDCNLEIQCDINMYPLNYAISLGYCEIIQILVQKCVATGNTKLINSAFVKYMYVSEYDYDFRGTSLYSGVRNDPILNLCENTTVEHCKEVYLKWLRNLLLKSGANINSQTDDGDTILMLAAKQKNLGKSILTSIKEGADVNMQNKKGKSVLMVASQYKILKNSIKILIDGGADINMQCNSGWTALMYASYNGNNTICNMLIKAGADINVCTKTTKKTALYLAIDNMKTSSNIVVVKTLIDAGAYLNMCTNEGWTVELLSVSKGFDYVTKLIQDKQTN